MCPSGSSRAELDELVVEERHADLERARHRGAVEVGEHVVDEAEPRVEVERGLERRRPRRARQPAAQHALGGAGVLRERAREQVARRSGCTIRSRRAGARPDRAACSASPAGARARPRRRRRGGAAQRAARVPAPGERGHAVLAVAAEQLVGALAGERDRHVRRRARRAAGSRARTGPPAARRGARRAGEVVGLGAQLDLELVVVGAVHRPRGARRRARSPRRRSRPRTSSTGSVHVARHQRDDQARVEAAAQHRAERDVAHQPQPTDSSSFASTISAHSARSALAGSAAGRG